MANFEPKKLDLDDINGGIRFTGSDGITPNAINDPIEAVAYSQTVVEHLTDTPDTSEIDGVGNPNVSFVSSTTADGVTIHKFKFSNLSGATFTPSLDEAGNLSWSNNRNLPNPPTINISGRDYLFSSEVLSGTSIPQVNSEVADIPLTSFNRAPVDDIDHCYLFYYYTPENIYYWLATQVVDIQETTATLKILSVVRLTGYTPTIGENGNWVINGEDTGKPSYGASGVTDVVAGASYNQDDFTITPLTFNFEVGNSKTVNVKAAIGDVEDGTYAKLAQVVRTDTAQSLTDEQKNYAKYNLAVATDGGGTTTGTIGWYNVAKFNYGNTTHTILMTIAQTHYAQGYQNIKLLINTSDENNFVITQLSGTLGYPSVTQLDEVRIRIVDSVAYIDVHQQSTAFNRNTIYFEDLQSEEFRSDSRYFLQPVNFEFVNNNDNVVQSIVFRNGFNTTGGLYQKNRLTMTELQVARTDILFPLDDEEFERFSSNIRHPHGQDYGLGWLLAVKIRNLANGYNYDYAANFLVNITPISDTIALGILQVRCSGTGVSSQGIKNIKLRYIGFADENIGFGAENFKAVINSEHLSTLDIYIKSPHKIGLQLLSDFRTAYTQIEFPFENTEEPEGGVFAEYFDIYAGKIHTTLSSPEWVVGTSGSLKLPSAGWYIIYGIYSYTGIIWWSPQDPSGAQVTVGYTAVNNDIIISASGVVSLLNGSTDSTIYYYKLA